jgi:hypothetical protein
MPSDLVPSKPPLLADEPVPDGGTAYAASTADKTDGLRRSCRNVVSPAGGLPDDASARSSTTRPATDASTNTEPGDSPLKCVPSDWDRLDIRTSSQPHRWFHPTAAVIRGPYGDVDWSSRAHRKGRHAVLRDERAQRPRFRWFFVWAPGNISWWVAELFTWGSVCWVVNGFFLMWPLGDANRNFKVTAASAMCGGTLFEFGALLAYVEALNVGHTADFGEAVEEAAEEHHVHHTGRPGAGATAPNVDGEGAAAPRERGGGSSVGPGLRTRTLRNLPLGSRHGHDKSNWRWFGADWHSLGFLAAFIQLIAATVFWMSVITGLPGVLNPENIATQDALFWAPQVVGGCGFIISSMLIMLEEQPSWWRIKPERIGWQVGFWNWVGGIGFTLSGIFGFWIFADRNQKWGTAFSSFWGGWAFLIGSYLQLLEVINPHPRYKAAKQE